MTRKAIEQMAKDCEEFERVIRLTCRAAWVEAAAKRKALHDAVRQYQLQRAREIK